LPFSLGAKRGADRINLCNIVTGVFAQYSLQEIAISQINQPVAFLRQKDFLSDDRWLALLSFNITQHAAVLSEL
jgi:hypothetical protein